MEEDERSGQQRGTGQPRAPRRAARPRQASSPRVKSAGEAQPGLGTLGGVLLPRASASWAGGQDKAWLS